MPTRPRRLLDYYNTEKRAKKPMEIGMKLKPGEDLSPRPQATPMSTGPSTGEMIQQGMSTLASVMSAGKSGATPGVAMPYGEPGVPMPGVTSGQAMNTGATGGAGDAGPKTPLMDFWSKPVMGKMSLAQVVGIAGGLSKAIAPDTPQGRVGGFLSNLGMSIYGKQLDTEMGQEDAALDRRHKEAQIRNLDRGKEKTYTGAVGQFHAIHGRVPKDAEELRQFRENLSLNDFDFETFEAKEDYKTEQYKEKETFETEEVRKRKGMPKWEGKGKTGKTADPNIAKKRKMDMDLKLSGIEAELANPVDSKGKNIPIEGQEIRAAWFNTNTSGSAVYAPAPAVETPWFSGGSDRPIEMRKIHIPAKLRSSPNPEDNWTPAKVQEKADEWNLSTWQVLEMIEAIPTTSTHRGPDA